MKRRQKYKREVIEYGNVLVVFMVWFKMEQEKENINKMEEIVKELNLFWDTYSKNFDSEFAQCVFDRYVQVLEELTHLIGAKSVLDEYNLVDMPVEEKMKYYHYYLNKLWPDLQCVEDDGQLDELHTRLYGLICSMQFNYFGYMIL